jgi:hypothetical protein
VWMRFRASVSRLFFVLTRRRLDEDARLEIEAHNRRTGPRAGVPSSCRRRQPWDRRGACWGFGAWTLARSTRVRHRSVRSSSPDRQRRRAYSGSSDRCLAPGAARDARRARNRDAGRRVMPGVGTAAQYTNEPYLLASSRKFIIRTATRPNRRTGRERLELPAQPFSAWRSPVALPGAATPPWRWLVCTAG